MEITFKKFLIIAFQYIEPFNFCGQFAIPYFEWGKISNFSIFGTGKIKMTDKSFFCLVV